MKLILSSICISSLVLANFSLLPQATAQCLTKNDDLSKATGSIDLSGVLEFNLRLFRELIPTDSKRNFIFSAYSIWNALTLAYLGSAGGQEQQLRTALGHNDKLSTLQKWRALEYFYKGRPQANVNNTFITASKAFFDQKIEIRACMENIFSNEIEKLDFTQPQRAAEHINAFVSEITKGNIKELVSAAVVDHARLVLVNAAYFKGTWQTTFDKERTKPDTFTDFDGNRYTVNMMDLFGEFNYVFSDQLKAAILELPYTGPSISMLLFLPVNNSLESFNNLLVEMSTNNYEAVINKLQASNKIKVKVNLPVFSLETQCGNELINALKSMGITDLFSPTKADFTAVTLDRSIFIDKSIHKAFIEVNEEGTTAGASTGLVTSKIAGGFPSFECRRPFLFAILDNETKNLLFMGVYKTPESKLPIAPIPGKDKENVPNRTSNPGARTSAGQNPNIPSFTEDIGLSAPGRASNQNSDKNVPFLGGEGGIVAPGRGLPLNPDHNIPETGDNSINFSASRGANLSPNSNIPGQGSNNQDQDPSNPVIRENRGRRDRNRRRGRVEFEESDD